MWLLGSVDGPKVGANVPAQAMLLEGIEDGRVVHSWVAEGLSDGTPGYPTRVSTVSRWTWGMVGPFQVCGVYRIGSDCCRSCTASCGDGITLKP